MTNSPERDAAGRLRRFERRIGFRLAVKAAWGRAVGSTPAAIQIVIAGIAAYSISVYVFGHPRPLIALTSTISILGFTRDARPRRVVESAVGILLGIVLSEALQLLIGHGIWQIALVLFLTLVVARFASASPALAVVAGVQATLVMVVPAPPGGTFTRSLDGLVGGVMALLVTALIPRDPRRAARRDEKLVLSVLVESMDTLEESLRTATQAAAELALDRLRRSQGLVNDWSASIESAIAIARISPFLRRRLPELRADARILKGADLAVRHLRVISRRVEYLVRDEPVPRPELAELVAGLAEGCSLLGDPATVLDARATLEGIARLLDPELVNPGAPLTDAAVLLLLRPLTVDLLEATGMSADDARRILPAL